MSCATHDEAELVSGGLMEFRVLGSLEVHRRGAAISIGSRMERALLAALLARANAVVSVEQLIEVLWGDDPPPSDRNSLQTYVARLRQRLQGADDHARIVTRPPGYLLEVTTDQVDALRFEDLLTRARRCRLQEPARALDLLDEALALWHGRAFVEFAQQDAARAEAIRLEGLREVAVEERIEALLATGRVPEALADLELLVDAHPLWERPQAQLMEALTRCGRQVEALRVFQTYRRQLAELGLEPSVELREVERQILCQEPPAPPPRSLVGPARALGNLLTPATSFVGREREVLELVSVLKKARITTLVGPGGVGKTRLALRLAEEVAHEYPDGAWFVDLASVTESDAIAYTIAGTLGVVQPSNRSIEEALSEFLTGRHLLVLLDNCEHLLDDVTPLIERLVRRCSDLTVLATSRERLAVDGEHIWSVPPLDEGSAVALFVERAQASRPDFFLDSASARTVVELCQGLDGLPLAIELAAARMQSFTILDLAERLGPELSFLEAPRRTQIERHRTLHTLVAWSYDLLDETEQRVFERISVFAGGWTLESASAICAGEDASQELMADTVARLVEKSMVVPPADEGTGRYRLLETLRQFAASRLDARGDAEQVSRTHVEYFLARAEEANQGLRGPDELQCVLRIRTDLDNLRAAHTWSRSRGEADLALRLSAALHAFASWQVNDEILTWAAAAVEMPSAVRHPLMPTVHGSAGVGACRRGNFTLAVQHARAGLEAGTSPDDPALALPFEVLGDVWSFSGRLDDAFEAYREAARLGRAVGDTLSEAYRLVSQALTRAYSGDLDTALTLADEVDELARRTRNPTTMAWALYVRGESLLEADPIQALALLEESLEVASSVENVFVTGVALLSATSLRGRHGAPLPALRSYREAIAHWHRYGNWTQQWITLRSLIELFTRVGALEPAAELYGATTTSAAAPAAFGSEAERLADLTDEIKRRLGRDAFSRAIRRGGRRPDSEVIAFATTSIEKILASYPGVSELDVVRGPA